VNGDTVAVVDAQGRINWLLREGTEVAPQGGLERTSVEDLPFEHAVMAPEAGTLGYPLLFVAAPLRTGNHVIGRWRSGPDQWAGTSASEVGYDDGEGPGPGQTLNPLALAYDPAGRRLLVLEAQGRIQVLDARPFAELGETKRRYITQWGSFGSGPGEFQPSPRTTASVVLDPQGRVYVADAAGSNGAGRVQVFEP
jgi:hypothetical protein